jgi:hypothetical protein
MTTNILRLSIISLFLLTSSGKAFGEDYTDPSGFSFTYPEGWVLLTADKLKDIKQFIPEETKNWINKNKIDFSRVKLMLIREPKAREEFVENLNVVVEKQQLPLDDQSVKKLTGSLTKEYEAIGAKIENFKSRVEKVGSREALVIDYKTQLPGATAPIRQRQVYFPGGGKTYIVTCTASVNSFDKYAPKFEKILETFKLPDPVPDKMAMSFDWNQILTLGWVKGVIVLGVLAAGLLAIMRLLMKR